MFGDMSEDQISGAIEAMLFVTDEPVSVIDLASMLETSPAIVEETLMDLRLEYEDNNRGIQLREVAGGWRLYTHPAYHDLIERYVISWDTRKLSAAALETLAIVAYCQPITRAGVASIRGVNSDSSINSLIEKGLLREAGTADAPGNPMLYATTRAFLERFGLRSVADLPDVAQFAPDEETRALICERLSATSSVSVKAEPDEKLQQQLDALADMQLRLIDEEEVPEHTSDKADQQDSYQMQQSLLNAALASGFGLTEKVDLSALKLEDEDE